MSWLTKIVTSGASELVDSVGNAVNSWFTTDEERDQKRNELQQIINANNEKNMEAISKFEGEVTERHKNDMNSDSWLSKNVRPMSLIFVTVMVVALAFCSIFILDVKDVVLVTPWISLFQALMIAMYTFYFGGRSFEKTRKYKEEIERLKAEIERTKKEE